MKPYRALVNNLGTLLSLYWFMYFVFHFDGIKEFSGLIKVVVVAAVTAHVLKNERMTFRSLTNIDDNGAVLVCLIMLVLIDCGQFVAEAATPRIIAENYS